MKYVESDCTIVVHKPTMHERWTEWDAGNENENERAKGDNRENTWFQLANFRYSTWTLEHSDTGCHFFSSSLLYTHKHTHTHLTNVEASNHVMNVRMGAGEGRQHSTTSFRFLLKLFVFETHKTRHNLCTATRTHVYNDIRSLMCERFALLA